MLEVELADTKEQVRLNRNRLHYLETSEAAARAAEAALTANRELLQQQQELHQQQQQQRGSRHLQIVMAFVAGAGVLWAIVSPFVLGHG